MREGDGGQTVGSEEGEEGSMSFGPSHIDYLEEAAKKLVQRLPQDAIAEALIGVGYELRLLNESLRNVVVKLVRDPAVELARYTGERF